MVQSSSRGEPNASRESREIRESRELRRAIGGYLRGLGASAPAVADRLGAEGACGVPGDPFDCALARYLHALVGVERSVERVVVKPRTARVHLDSSRLPLVVRLPRPVARFIQGFDAGWFPELIDGPAVLAAGYAPGVGPLVIDQERG